MRVNQIQNLTWAANVLLLGGLAWVGMSFWRVKTTKPSIDLAWPKAGKTDEIRPRWPGEIAGFAHISTTPISGAVPPPPEKTAAPVKLDRTTEFTSKLKYLGGFEFLTHPELTIVRLSYDGKEMSVNPGQEIGTTGFQLQGVVVKREKDAKGEVQVTHVLTFKNPDTGATFPIPFAQAPGAPLTDERIAKFERVLGDGLERAVPKENAKLAATPFTDPASGDVIIPEESQDWIRAHGEKSLLGTLGTETAVDKEGRPKGLRVKSAPGQNTPLGVSSGVYPEDVLLSINGVPVTSKEEVLLYLRGDGKGLDKYVVVLDRAGQEKTVVYRIPRRGTVSRD
jgi:hypothetical protein